MVVAVVVAVAVGQYDITHCFKFSAAYDRRL
jgi:hypothetical protein